MALKSYRLREFIKKGKKMKIKKGIRKGLGKIKPIGSLVVGGVTAIIGVGLLDQTAQAVNRI